MKRRDFIALGLGLIGCKDELEDMKINKLNWWWMGGLNPAAFGEIFTDNFNRASIGGDYTVVGTAPTLDGSKLSYSAAAGATILTNYFVRNYYQSFELFSFTGTFTINHTPSATQTGFTIGVKTSAITNNWDVLASYYSTSGAANDGKILLRVGNGTNNDTDSALTLRNTSSGTLTPVNGRAYTFNLSRTIGTTGATYTATLTDNVTLSSITATWTEDISVPSSTAGVSFANKTARELIGSLGGNFDVTNITFSSNALKNVNTLLVGDSISHGLNATNIASRFANLVPFDEVAAGPSNITADIVNQLDNLNAYNARTVYLFIGTNDIIAGNIATAQTNYPTIVSSLKANGSQVVHLYALPRVGNTSINTWNAWLSSTYSGDTIIDVNTLFNNGSNAMIGSLTLDTVHPSNGGHLLLSNIINNTNTFVPDDLNPVVYYDNDAAYMASDGSQWTDRINGLNVTSTGTAIPTYTTNLQNGRAAFVFDGSNDVLSRARITQIQGIQKLTMWGVGYRYAFGQDDGIASYLYRTGILQFTDNVVYVPVANGVTNTFGQQTSPVVTTNSHWIMVYDGTQTGNANRLKVWINGKQITMNYSGTIPSTLENNSGVTFNIGKTVNIFLAGRSFEHGIVTDALTSNQILNLSVFLGTRYKL